MQIGDLVTYWYQLSRWREGLSVHVGLVVETGKYTGNADVKVLWHGTTEAVTQKSGHLSLIDDSLTQS